jgi:tetracycline 7-halogenase / FADH2 O2-dependent halogenase
MCAVCGGGVMVRCDIAVIGSGFSGSLMAMIARQLGHSAVLIEKGTHPRVVIGESSTPLANLLLEELSARYGLGGLKPLAKWGSWQRANPQVACGLKRGFTFHHHVLGAPAAPDLKRSDQLLVAASPHNEIADMHWYRADFDYFLLHEAQKLGVDYFDRTTLREFEDDGKEVKLCGEREGRALEFGAQFVVDATGPRGFLHRALGLREAELPGFPATQTLYNHFTGVRRLDETAYSRTDEIPPYPIDDAAVHHVFDGGWIWVLRFNNGLTSAGVAATDELAERLRLTEGPAAWQKLLTLIPALNEQFGGAKPERGFTHLPRLAFRSASIAGERWTMLPSAAGFVDPLLSTGFPLTLLGVLRMAEIIERDWDTDQFSLRLKDYAAQTDRELMATSRLIAALYANMSNFDVFIALTLLYFAAASFSEAARRLGKPHLAQSFLLSTHPKFGPECESLCARAMQKPAGEAARELVAEILAAIEPFNVAGLGQPGRRNWYPVQADDLLNASTKLGASRDDVQVLLERCGFVCPPSAAIAQMPG